MGINSVKEKTKQFPLIGIKTSDITLTLFLVFAAIAAPVVFAHAPQNQLLTGTIVNGLLFYAAWRLGLINALLVAVIPSTVALIQGLLPAPFALMIPYIISANSLLVVTFIALKNRPIIGIASASIVKFSFIFMFATFLSAKNASGVLIMFHWPQLLTALLGGMLAYIVFQFRK